MFDRHRHIYMERIRARAKQNAVKINSRRIRRKINKAIGQSLLYTETHTHRANVYKIYLFVAAAAVLLVVAGIWFFKHDGNPIKTSLLPESAVGLVHGTKPTFTIEGKDTVKLEDIPIGDTVNRGYVRLIRTGKHSIDVKIPASQYSLIAIPFGQSWHVSFQDVINMDIAPGSDLTFQSDKDGVLTAELKGEAYFDALPHAKTIFAVKTRYHLTEVMGTTFNISSDDSSSTTTLIRGKVKVSQRNFTGILRPGEEAVSSMGILKLGEEAVPSIGNVTVITKRVDTTIRLLWRTPYFEFDNMDIRQFMQQVTRWYGMNGTKFDKRVDTVSYGLLGGGHIGKDLTLKELLQMLNSENQLSFDIGKDKIIYVKPRSKPYTSFAKFKPTMSICSSVLDTRIH